jgi:cytochrome b
MVYDLPTRIFHWLFVAQFLTAIVIGKWFDHESLEFSYHMLAGLTLGFLVLFRVLWGFVGTKHARFSDFALNPIDLIGYFRGMFSGDKRLWPGHNPASSWAAITMMVLAQGLGVSGYLMTSGSENGVLADVHEILANTFIIVACLHVIGIIMHTIRHKEFIGLSMVDGKKTAISSRDIISSSRPAMGVLLLGLTVGFCMNLASNFDAEAQTLQFFGTTLNLSGEEGEDENGGEDEDDESRIRQPSDSENADEDGYKDDEEDEDDQYQEG